jgi:predicted TIM-barrel fold metal-dependent hydrolase
MRVLSPSNASASPDYFNANKNITMKKYAWLLVLAIGCVRGSTARLDQPQDPVSATSRRAISTRHTIFPIAAHHQHLVGPAVLAVWHKGPMPSTPLPPELDALLRGHGALMGAAAPSEAYKDVYASDAILLDPVWVVKGAAAIAKWWATYGGPAGTVRYVVPSAYELGDNRGFIAGTMVQHQRDSTTRYARRLLYVLMHVEKGVDGKWRIAAESATLLTRPENADTLPAASLVADMDEIGVARGVVAALGYQFAKGPETPGELALVQAENDWTVSQVAQFPERLVVFCGVNPLRGYAIAEMDRCAKMPPVRGMKLYFGDRVDLKNSQHVETLRHFFRAANERRMPLLVHLYTNQSYGGADARTFFDQVLPVAPDIPIQLAHVAGGGPFSIKGADDALKVFADAAAVGNPLMKNLYFDLTGVVHNTSATVRDTLARRLRTIGLHRILFGSDLPFPPLEPVGPAWIRFRKLMPLTDDELRVIAGNVAPYAR